MHERTWEGTPPGTLREPSAPCCKGSRRETPRPWKFCGSASALDFTAMRPPVFRGRGGGRRHYRSSDGRGRTLRSALQSQPRNASPPGCTASPAGWFTGSFAAGVGPRFPSTDSRTRRPSPPPEDHTSHLEAQQKVRLLAAALSPAEMEVLVLHLVHGFTVPELARLLKHSERAVDSLLYRARTKARERLAQDARMNEKTASWRRCWRPPNPPLNGLASACRGRDDGGGFLPPGRRISGAAAHRLRRRLGRPDSLRRLAHYRPRRRSPR